MKILGGISLGQNGWPGIFDERLLVEQGSESRLNCSTSSTCAHQRQRTRLRPSSAVSPEMSSYLPEQRSTKEDGLLLEISTVEVEMCLCARN